MLPGKGYPDDGNKQDCSKDQVNKGSIQTTKEEPDDIAEQGKTACALTGGNNLFPEWPKNKSCYFKALHTPGNTHNSDAQDKSSEHITHGSQKAAKQEPD